MKKKKLTNLIQLRENRGLSQEGFARLLNVTTQTQYKVENGYIPASRNYMDKIKRLFPDAKIDDLFFGS